eukprot:CAMPEP_0179110146 /NCGR_PEP_ID=MMETSP0796-20121207/51393_1 /TAXON_ID=73915 /ORGANISM="Pyrodinium bahamense, Strain pbaha01" /LENGTH=394 /DNA_ID=CAMNT_0020808275 /DNA_START=24 /DNA_END=1209 /DNA_ORIENTATION=-
MLGANCKKAFPARALFARLHLAGEPPTWAAYLPASLQHAMQEQSWAVRPGSPGASSITPSSTRACSGRPTTGHEERALESWAEHGEAEGPNKLALEEMWWSGRVWSLSRDPTGCREVQAALDAAQSEEERIALAAELQGRISEALRCPHANYVLQKCITVMRPRHLQFIVDEILFKGAGAVAHVARHKYGCRIIQRLLEHLSAAQLHGLVEGLLVDAIATCKHPYGNYVMQHLLEHGTARQRHDLIQLLTQHAATVGKDSYACEVVGKAMALGTREDQVSLARALLQVPGFIPLMARTQRGHVSTKLILRVLEGPEHEEARCKISAEAALTRGRRDAQLSSSRQGAAGARRPSSPPRGASTEVPPPWQRRPELFVVMGGAGQALLQLWRREFLL